jgi:methyl-accepting chemotaxis protein
MPLKIKTGDEHMNKRKNYFIDKKFQTNFILKFCLLVAITGALIMVILYALTKTTNTVSFVNSRVVVQSTADFLFPLLVQTFIISTIMVSLATIFVTLFISHRIAGPMYRFKKILGSLGAGDFLISCRIRRKDALHDMVSAFNDMITRVRESLNLIDKDLKGLEEKLEAGDLREIKRSVLETGKALHHFKF